MLTQENLDQINTRIQQTAYAPFIVVGTTLVALAATFLAWWVGVIVVVIGGVTAWFVHQRDTRKRTTDIIYQLDADATKIC